MIFFVANLIAVLCHSMFGFTSVPVPPSGDLCEISRVAEFLYGGEAIDKEFRHFDSLAGAVIVDPIPKVSKPGTKVEGVFSFRGNRNRGSKD